MAKTSTSTVGPWQRPVGLQLYTVRALAAEDFEGTLEAVAAIGYREVELGRMHGRTSAEVLAILRAAGLTAPAVHYTMYDLREDLARKLDDLNTIGARYLVCTFPGTPDPDRFADWPGGPGPAILAGELTLDDWRWNAEQLNRVAEAARRAGLQVAYHNHSMEFRRYGDTVAFDELLRLTDPETVGLELDCAWVAQGGHDPAHYLQRHQDRVRLLHVKDVRRAEKFTTTELGRGIIDWHRVFAAADPERVDHYFVEQEHFERPPLEAIEISLRFLEQLEV